MEYKIFVDYSSVGELGTTIARTSCTGKSNAAKGIENHFNKYREFHLKETEAHVVASFMAMMDMKKKSQNYFSISQLYINICLKKVVIRECILPIHGYAILQAKIITKERQLSYTTSQNTTGTTVDSDYELAETLNAQFQNNWSHEDLNSVPFLLKTTPGIGNIVITTNGISKLLNDLKPSKSAG